VPFLILPADRGTQRAELQMYYVPFFFFFFFKKLLLLFFKFILNPLKIYIKLHALLKNTNVSIYYTIISLS